MNTQRIFFNAIVVSVVLFSMHINAMYTVPTSINFESSQSISFNRDCFLLATGIIAGAACVGAYCWYNNNEKKINILNERTKRIEDASKNYETQLSDIRHRVSIIEQSLASIKDRITNVENLCSNLEALYTPETCSSSSND